MFKHVLVLSALVAGSASIASAATIMQTATLTAQTTNYAGEAIGPIAKFDASLGTLNSVSVKLDGVVNGSISYESLDAAPTVVTGVLSAQIDLSTGAAGPLVVVLPTRTEIRNVTAFDGVIDFTGASGGSLTGLSGTDSKTTTVTGTGLADFIGTGNVGFQLSASALSSASGPGNLLTQFSTFAGATVEVTYDYDAGLAPIPLPAGGLLLLSGLAGAAALGRRRKQAR